MWTFLKTGQDLSLTLIKCCENLHRTLKHFNNAEVTHPVSIYLQIVKVNNICLFIIITIYETFSLLLYNESHNLQKTEIHVCLAWLPCCEFLVGMSDLSWRADTILKALWNSMFYHYIYFPNIARGSLLWSSLTLSKSLFITWVFEQAYIRPGLGDEGLMEDVLEGWGAHWGVGWALLCLYLISPSSRLLQTWGQWAGQQIETWQSLYTIQRKYH